MTRLKMLALCSMVVTVDILADVIDERSELWMIFLTRILLRCSILKQWASVHACSSCTAPRLGTLLRGHTLNPRSTTGRSDRCPKECRPFRNKILQDRKHGAYKTLCIYDNGRTFQATFSPKQKPVFNFAMRPFDMLPDGWNRRYSYVAKLT